jgi:hypothetical protein
MIHHTRELGGFARRLAAWGAAAVLLQAGCDTVPAAEPGVPATSAAMTDSLGRPLGPISSDIVAANASLSQKLHLLARIEVQPNEMLEFYEPLPGSILVSGAGAPKGGSRLTNRPDATVEQWWRAAAGGTKMPAALTEAVARAKRAALLSSGGATTAGTERGVEGSATASDDERLRVPQRPEPISPAAVGFCDDPYGYYMTPSYRNCPRSASVTTCQEGWWNGIFTGVYGPTYSVRSQVCPTNGNVVLRLEAWEKPRSCPPWPLRCTQTGGLPIGTWDQSVLANTIRWWTWENIDSRPMVQSQVVQASGVRFHFVYGAWANKPVSTIWE